MWNAVVFFFLILIFSNHKLINLLIVNDLLVRVFVFCKYALVAFPSEIHSFLFYSILFDNFLLFFMKYLSKVIVSEVYIKTLIWNIWRPLFFYVFYFPSEVVHLAFPPRIFPVSGKFEVCYTTCQWGEFRIK